MEANTWISDAKKVKNITTINDNDGVNGAHGATEKAGDF